MLDYFDETKINSLHFTDSIAQDYELGDQIGIGVTSKVYKAVHRHTGIDCALKIIKKRLLQNSKQMQIQIFNQMVIQEQLNHRCIGGIYEMLHDSENLYLVSEPAYFGTLYDYVDRRIKSGNGPVEEREVQQIAK